ncbi:TM0106 family RecB-like putative nuclease [Synechococcus sp. 63AY4M1]|uniref:TM0106 family RecB-like putative nuclease n=1 Tax=Synechococcus sp. 63AY4M1 TaxID=1353263 RepID=UPI001F0B6AB9|nr:TM0106 family RecB-like putative nuclease [Synechococcus sp. 63AY4M1]
MLAFFRCRRLPYLDRFGPQEAKLPPESLLEQWRRDRQALQAAVLERFPGEEVAPGNEALLAAMAAGAERIYGGQVVAKLFWEVDPEGAAEAEPTDSEVALAPSLETEVELTEDNSTDKTSSSLALPPEAIPEFRSVWVSSSLDLLIRDPSSIGKGQLSYLPVHIRIGKRPKPEYELLLALQAELLGSLQGQVPKCGFLILKDGKWHLVHLSRRRTQVRRLLQDYLHSLEQAEPPQVFMARSRCHLCHWREHCRQLNAAAQPLSLLPGVTGSRYPLLQEAGIHSIEALANARLEMLQAIPKLGAGVALQLQLQARATLSRKPLWLQSPPQALPTAPVELYFDIEADPRHNVAYLLGLLVVEQAEENKVVNYYSCLAAEPREEGQAWQQFLQLVQRYPEAPIYHFHSFEVQTCRRLGEQHQTDPREVRQLLKRFVDLHSWVQRSVVLPIESYSLKNIARWLGFKWRLPEGSGAHSIYWYSQWLETRDRRYLEQSLIYNEDDCRATYCLKNWLSQGSVLAPVDGPSPDTWAGH